MAVKTKIPLEKITAIQKRLQKLPVKNTGKNRDEAMELLAPDFQKALEKGYTLKDLRKIVTEEGATLPLSKLTDKPASESASSAQEDAKEPANEPVSESEILEQGKLQKLTGELKNSVRENVEKPGEELNSSMRVKAAAIAEQAQRKQAGEKQGFPIKPDTPKDEL